MDDLNVIQQSGNQDQSAQSLDRPGETSFELSDGRKAVLRQGTGKDLMLAQRAAKNNDEVTWALAARLLTIEDKPVLVEDLFELNLGDSLNIFGRLDQVFLSPRANSSTSPTSQSGVTLN